MQTSAKPVSKTQTTVLRLLLAVPILYIILLAGQPAGLDIPRTVDFNEDGMIALDDERVVGMMVRHETYPAAQ